MSSTWYFPIDKDWVLACDWNLSQGQYNRNCRPMRKADIPAGDDVSDSIAGVAASFEATKQVRPATWYFPTRRPDVVLSCDLNEDTGRYELNPRRVRTSDLGRDPDKEPRGAGWGAGLMNALSGEMGRKRPGLADVVLLIGGLAIVSFVLDSMLDASAPRRRT